MDKKQKLFLLFTGLCMIAVIAVVTFNIFMPKPEPIKPEDVQVTQRSLEEEKVEKTQEKTKEYVVVFFIGKNEHGEEVYKALKRVYNPEIDGSKIRFAMYNLIKGPSDDEYRNGVYSEIPSATQILNIKELPDQIIINFTSDFVNGGGADSLYKRLYQLIKTVKQNTNIPVYLYIDGERADIIGGEGIMLTQPLSNSSLEN